MPRYGMQVELDTENNAVVYTVVDRDEDNEEIGEHSFDMSRIHDSLVQRVGLYGGRALLNDRTSDVKVKEVGLGKFDAMEIVLARLEAGEWESERKGGAPTVSVEVEALAEHKGISVAVAQKALRNYTKEQRTAILNHPKIQETAARLKEERETAPEASLDELLS